MVILPSGTPSIICQRCRLRETLLHFRLRRQARLPARSFTQQTYRSQEFGQDVAKRKEKDIVWKHFGSQGKLVGRHGRRQRVVSEKLSTKVLDERVSPSQIIVFQDVRDEARAPQRQPVAPVQHDPNRKPLSAKQITDFIAGRSDTPEEVVVNTSIDDLRPDETSVDEDGFEKLRQTLLQGYNYPQLSGYLTARIGHEVAPLSKFAVPELRTSQWQKGETPLAKRQRMAKAHRVNTKLGVVDQILRLVWDVTVQSDIQGIGELEMRLQPWQLSLLFDLPTSDGKPYYERFINPAILLEASQVYQYRPDNIVRIVGRRPVAEEVAKQLRLAVLGMKKLELDLTLFTKSNSRGSEKTVPEAMFQDLDLRYVSDTTKCIIAPERAHYIAIYGYDEASARNAQRALLSLLGLPPSSTFDQVSSAALELIPGAPKRSTLITADVVDLGLPRQHRQLHLSRVRDPAPCLQRSGSQPHASEGNLEISKLVERLEYQIDHVAESTNGSSLWPQTSGSYWRNEVRLGEWEAEFCRLLSEKTIEPAGRRRQTKSKLQPNTNLKTQNILPGSEALLSYFTPLDLPRPLDLQMGEKRGKVVFDRRLPFLNAHFIPSPLPGMPWTKLPHITMRFRFSAPTSTHEPRELRLLGLRAKVDEQRLKVPLPGASMDVCFTRSSTMISHSNFVNKDDDIHKFCTHLRESVQFGKGALDAPSELTIKLPRFLVNGGEEDKSTEGEVEVRYLFERFEQVQSVEFMPTRDIANGEGVDQEVTNLIKSLPAGCYLDYREIDGGAVYGNSTSLSLRISPSYAEKEKSSEAKADQIDSSVSEQESTHQSEAVSENEGHNTLNNEQLDTAEHEVQVSQANKADANGDVHAMEENAESSPDLSANASSAGLVAAALRIAGLLTRANAGTLRRLGGR